MINVTGSYADRLQNGAFAIIKLLNVFADKISASGDAGRSSSPQLRETISPRPKTLPPAFLETTDFSELEEIPRRRK